MNVNEMLVFGLAGMAALVVLVFVLARIERWLDSPLAWPDGTPRHFLDAPDAQTDRRWQALARYNDERARGIAHGEQYQALMEQVQHEWDRAHRDPELAALEELGWTVDPASRRGRRYLRHKEA